MANANENVLLNTLSNWLSNKSITERLNKFQKRKRKYIKLMQIQIKFAVNFFIYDQVSSQHLIFPYKKCI